MNQTIHAIHRLNDSICGRIRSFVLCCTASFNDALHYINKCRAKVYVIQLKFQHQLWPKVASTCHKSCRESWVELPACPFQCIFYHIALQFPSHRPAWCSSASSLEWVLLLALLLLLIWSWADLLSTNQDQTCCFMLLHITRPLPIL